LCFFFLEYFFLSLCLTVDGGRDLRRDLNSWRIDGNFFIQFFPSDLGLAGCTIEPSIATQYPIMFGGRNVNSFIAFTNVFVSGLYLKVVAATWLLTNNTHNFLPFTTMWHNVIPINMTRNEVCSFVAGSVIDKSISIGMKHIIVESNFIQKTLSITSATALQLEADCGEDEAHVVKFASHVVGFVDSLDCFALQFSHASTIAPCSARAREKEKKVCA